MTTAEKAVQELRPMVDAYLLARVHAEVLREKVDAICRQVLAEAPLKVSAKNAERGMPELITEPNRAWLADLDSPEMQDYDAECDKRLRAAGLKPESMPADHCPALVAERIKVEAEWLLLETAWQAIGQSGDGWKGLYGDNRKKFLDLCVGLVVNSPGYQNPLTGKAA